MSYDERFDNLNHWLETDHNGSRSNCKLPGCGMLTHVFCTKCTVHLCVNKNRNCFHQYHLPGNQQSKLEEQQGKIRTSKHTKRKPYVKGQTHWKDSFNLGSSKDVLDSASKITVTKTNKNHRKKNQNITVDGTRLLRKREINLEANDRYDNFNHWLKMDGNGSRSNCKMPGCGMLTNAFCTKCSVHLCLTSGRNCFHLYHLKSDANIKEEQNTSLRTKQTVPMTKKSSVQKKDPKIKRLQREALNDRYKKIRQAANDEIIENKQLQLQENSINIGGSKDEADRNSVAKVTTTKISKTRHEMEQIITVNDIRFLRKRAVNLRVVESSQNKNRSKTNQTKTMILPPFHPQNIQMNQNVTLKTQFFSYLRLYANKNE